MRGISAAVGAGLMFGSMYIPYRKADITGMNPLTLLTFFTFGEMTMMAIVALYLQVASRRSGINWLLTDELRQRPIILAQLEDIERERPRRP